MKKEKKNEELESKTAEASLETSELSDDAMDAVCGAGEEAAFIPRVQNQKLNKSIRDNAR